MKLKKHIFAYKCDRRKYSHVSVPYRF